MTTLQPQEQADHRYEKRHVVLSWLLSDSIPTVCLVLSPLLLAAAFPPWNLFWLAWVALAVPAYWTLCGKWFQKCIGLALGGTVWMLLILDWMRTAWGDEASWWGPLAGGWLALGCLGGLTVTLSAMLFRALVITGRLPSAVALPVAWIFGEVSRDMSCRAVGGLCADVASLAVTQAICPFLLIPASWGGASAVSAVVAFGNGVLVDVFRARWRHQFIPGSISVLLASTLFLLSMISLDTNNEGATSERIRVCCVPKMVTHDNLKAVERYASGAAVAIWPEHALNHPLPLDCVTLRDFNGSESGWRLPCPAIVGCERESRTPLGVFNSAILVSPEGSVLDYCDKQFLTPVQEVRFSPGRWLGISPTIHCADYLPGTAQHVLQLDSGIRLGVGICHDVWFPEWSSTLTTNGDCDLLVCCASNHFAHSHHIRSCLKALLAIHAVRSRKPVISCDRNGDVFVIDESGRVVLESQNQIEAFDIVIRG